MTWPDAPCDLYQVGSPRATDWVIQIWSARANTPFSHIAHHTNTQVTTSESYVHKYNFCFLIKNCRFMSIAVRKNHLPGIGAHSVEKGLKINIHTITHLKYIVLLFNMWRERHIFHTIVTTHNRTTSEESVGVIYNLTWLSMSIMVSQERFKVFAMKHLTHCGLKLFPIASIDASPQNSPIIARRHNCCFLRYTRKSIQAQ